MHTQVGELHVRHGGGWTQENDYTVHEGSLEEKTETRRSSSKLRTSDDFRTFDVSDVPDVRTHDKEIANASDVRQTLDVRHLGRPKPIGRPNLPVCSSGPWAMYPLPLPLDYKYPFTTSFLGLAKIISRFERA